MLKLNKCQCALCGKSMTQVDFQMPSGATVCLGCAKEIYIAVIAIETLIKQEKLEQ